MTTNIETKAVNAIRILSADGIQRANSGHPGLPLGCAAMAYELFAHDMNPKLGKSRSIHSFWWPWINAFILFISFIWLWRSFY